MQIALSGTVFTDSRQYMHCNHHHMALPPLLIPSPIPPPRPLSSSLVLQECEQLRTTSLQAGTTATRLAGENEVLQGEKLELQTELEVERVKVGLAVAMATRQSLHNYLLNYMHPCCTV